MEQLTDPMTSGKKKARKKNSENNTEKDSSANVANLHIRVDEKILSRIDVRGEIMICQISS
jgi:hypothetical protein